MTKYWELLEQCAEIAKERESYYGDVVDNFTSIQEILKVAFGKELSINDIILVNLATKLSREKNRHKEDNILDMINYLAIGLHLKDERQ